MIAVSSTWRRWLAGLAFAAGPAGAQDSTAVLPWETFAARVVRNHPVARAARLGRAQADEDVRIAQGGFDPTVTASWDRKAKKGTDAYNDLVAELKVPTVTGADVKLGYSRGLGPNVNPVDATGGAGLLSLGVSLPLGQRLITDERRTALQQARAARDLAEADRVGVLNALWLRAARDYGRWFEAVRRAEIARDGYQLATFRLRAVTARVRGGEAPAIDTVEARLEVQRRETQLVEAEQARVAATLTAQAYWWDDRGQPEDLPAASRPAVPPFEELVPDSARIARWLAVADREHPELRKAEARVRQADGQRRLVQQQLLPAASLDLAALAEGDHPDGLTDGGSYAGNYKFGASLKTPVLLLKERGKLAQADQKLEQQRVVQAQLRRDVANAVRLGANDLGALARLIAAQRDIVVQARALLAGEVRRFDHGESSLLIVNLRERLVLDEEVRLAALQARAVAVRAELGVAVGTTGPLP